MSSIKLESNVSGTGVFTIASPNSNSNRTLTLPDATGTINTSGAVNEVPAGSAASPSITFTGDTNTGIFSPAADTIAFSEGGAESMRIDSSGNVGIGVTPSAWTSTWKAFQGIGGSFVNRSGAVELITNAYFDGTNFKYINTGGTGATRLNIGEGYAWGIAPAGTAGNNITFTTAMTLDTSGNVGIGTTAPTEALDVSSSSAAKSISVGRTPYSTYGNLLFDGTNNAVASQTNSSGNSTCNVGAARIVCGDVIAFSTSPQTAAGSARTWTERARITSGGDLLVGTTSSVSSLADGNASTNGMGYRNNSTGCWLALQNEAASCFYASKKTGYTDSRFMQFSVNATGVGSITTNGTNTTYGTTSDYRLKENIAPMAGALEKVSQLKPVTYTWKLNGSAGQGFIAHELQEVCPDAVVGEKDATEIKQVKVSDAIPATYDEDGNELTPAVETVYEEREVPKYQGVDTSFLVATLTAAIQELKAITDAQATRIETLEAQNAAFEARLAALEAK